MLRDRWGSDVDYDTAHGNGDGWSLDAARADWCEDHGQRGSTCGACHAEGRFADYDSPFYRPNDGTVYPDGAYDDAPDEASDEARGAALSARFEVSS